MALRIIIFEDNDKLRESMVFLLNNMEDYEVAGDYNNCMDAGNITRRYKPDVVLMDIDMPGISGIKGVSMVKEARSDTAVIMFTVFEDDEKLFQCLCAGAGGYLLKKISPSKTNQYSLTARELEVLTMLTKGYSTKMIAAGLFISFETARSHLKNIYTKLHVNCGKEAISKALKEHII